MLPWMSRLAPLCLFAFSTVAGAAPPAAPDAGIDGLMQRYDGRVPGAAVLVLKDGQPVFRRGYGLAVLEDGTPVSPATNFRLASVSKQFTAAAVLLLAQSGKLSIDDPVRRWLPSLPPAADGITLQHLLDHTSGVLDYEDLMAKPFAGQISDAGVLALLEQQDRLNFTPGSTYRYSNSGYALLALVVERASGQSFPDFLRSRIFKPLGMRSSLAYVAHGPSIRHRAWGYSEQDGIWQRTDQNAYSAVLGDGGIYSNIDDLARWDAALYDDRLLDDAMRARAFGKQVKVSGDPEATYYGYGWRVNQDGSRQWHSGESIGFRNVIVRHPEKHLTVIVLTNRNDPEPYPLAQKIAQRWLDTLQ